MVLYVPLAGREFAGVDEGEDWRMGWDVFCALPKQGGGAGKGGSVAWMRCVMALLVKPSETSGRRRSGCTGE